MLLPSMPVWSEINLDSLSHNMKAIRSLVPPTSKIMAVVKANAYGHGSVESSRVFLENGADKLAVATLSEAVELRVAGITAPILILGYTSSDQAELILKWKITPTVYSLKCAEGFGAAAEKAERIINIHIKIDTGLGRIGFQPDEASIEALGVIKDIPYINIEGLYTHFALADSEDKSYTQKQFNVFKKFLDRLTERDINIPLKHTNNSAAIIDLPEYSLDMVRPGCILYGLYPSGLTKRDTVLLKPVMTLKTRVTHVKTVPPGTGISYGLTYTTKNESCLGSLSVGYADGYSRALSNKAEVWIRNERAPVVGRVCMDQTIVDITDAQKPAVGDSVVLFGDGRSGEPTAADMANWMRSITDEVVSSISRRVPRVYLNDGGIVKIVNYLNEMKNV
jgi:alanine racemase